MRESLFEAMVGGLVVVVAAIFLGYSLRQGASGGGGEGYELTASFNRIDGVATGSDVRLAGVKVGAISEIAIDPQSYQALVTFTVREGLQIPDDTTAQVQSDGLLGGAYLGLLPGGSPDYIAPGGRVEYTRGSVDLLTVLSQFASGMGDGGGSGSDLGIDGEIFE